jgi:hypothetical protein
VVIYPQNQDNHIQLYDDANSSYKIEVTWFLFDHNCQEWMVILKVMMAKNYHTLNIKQKRYIADNLLKIST